MIIFVLAFFIAIAGYGGYRYAGDPRVRIATRRTFRENVEHWGLVGHWVLGIYSTALLITGVWLILTFAP